MKLVVERLIVAKNIAIAMGWSEDEVPEILVKGKVAERQVKHRSIRPDVSRHLDQSEDIPFGFIVSALLPEIGLSKQDITLVLPGDTEIIPIAPNSDDRINEVFDRFVKKVNNAPKGAAILELGSRARSGNTYRSWISDEMAYVGVDIVQGENVDLVGDIHTLSRFVDRKFDFAISISVFEHLLMPWVAAFELNKVLMDGGIAYIQSHPTWPLHDEPWDFFRFSKHSWHALFNRLTGFEILQAAHGLEGYIMAAASDDSKLNDLILQPTFLLSACMVKKISEPSVNWECDPEGIFDLQYDH